MVLDDDPCFRKRRAGGWYVRWRDDETTLGWVLRDRRIRGWRAYVRLPSWTNGVETAATYAYRRSAAAAVIEWHVERNRRATTEQS